MTEDNKNVPIPVMSSKSELHPRSNRPHGKHFIIIVVILLIACAAWFARYTQALEGRAVAPPSGTIGK